MDDTPPPADAPEAAPPIPAASRFWRSPIMPREAERQRRAARRRRTALLLGVTIAAGLAVVAVVSWLRPAVDPVLLPLWVTDYAGLLPDPPRTAADRDGLTAAGVLRREAATFPPRIDGPTLLAGPRLLQSLHPSEGVVVVLGGYAVADADGSARVLPGGTDPAGDGGVKLRDWLAAVQAVPAREKLVVLDLAWPVAGVERGILIDDAAAAVRRDVDAVPDAARLVLTSAAGGQRPLASPDLGRTVFGHYFEEGLRGAADGFGGRRDGSITARELAAFVKSRVRRWSLRAGPSVQTPELIGADGFDFPVRALPRSGSEVPRELPTPEPYPAFIKDGWAMREKWQAEGVHRLAPQLARQLDATLLGAEHEWLTGAAEELRLNRKIQLDRLTRELRQLRAVAVPEPRSVALAKTQGRPFDPALREAFATEYVKATGPKPAGDAKPDEAVVKRAAELADKLAKAGPLDLTAAAWDWLTGEADLTVAKVKFAADRVRAVEAQPRTAEALALVRMADRGGWTPAELQRYRDMVAKGEQAFAQLDGFAAAKPLLDEAARRRHEAEVLAASPGFVSREALTERIRRATDAADAALVQAGTVAAVRGALDDALQLLPAAVPYVLDHPREERPWQAAAEIARELLDALAVPGNATPSADELRALGDDLRRRADGLSEAVEEVRRPLAADRVRELVAAGRRAELSPATLRELESVLRTPGLPAALRTEAWAAARSLAGKLTAEVVQIDERDDAGKQVQLAPDSEEGQSLRLRREERERGLIRARTALTLLGLGGLAEGTQADLAGLLKIAEASRDDAARSKALAALATPLRQALVAGLPAQAANEQDPAVRDRLQRVALPVPVGAPGDAPIARRLPPRLQGRLGLYDWLAAAARHGNRDPADAAGATLAGVAARGYAPDTADHTLRMNAAPALVAFGPSTPSVGLTLQLQRGGPPGGAADVVLRVLLPDGNWLAVEPDGDDALDSTGAIRVRPEPAAQVPLRVRWNPDALRAGGPKPTGFLIEATHAGRTSYLRVPVSFDGVSDRVELLVSRDPREPRDPVGDVRLRPLKTPQAYFLYLRNPTGRVRNLVVQLATEAGPIPNSDVKLAVPPGATLPVRPVPVSVPNATPNPTPPPASAELPDLPGQLAVRILDADKGNAVVLAVPLTASVSSPREYVQIVNALWTPQGPRGNRNRLAVTLRSVAGGPPVPVELLLKPEMIPGLLPTPPVEGSFRGELPADGDSVTLFAEALPLVEDAEVEGQVFLAADGVDRAFVLRTSFVRRGNPSTPREDDRLGLRINADRYARTGGRAEVQIEVDNPPAGSTLDVGQGRFEAGKFVAEGPGLRALPSARRERIGFGLRADGALLFEASVADWRVPLDTRKTVGERDLRVRLLDSAGFERLVALRRIAVDEQPPAGVRFEPLPQRHRRDTPLPVVAVVEPGLTGVAAVEFFFGAPVDGKPPAGAVPGEPLDAARTRWAAKLPVPADRAKGPANVGVRATSGAGLSAFGIGATELLDADDFTKLPGSIAGTLMEGTRPQPGLTVSLRDEKGNELLTAKTDDAGKFKFAAVPPGKYVLTAGKSTPPRKARKPVTVEAGQAAVVEVPMYL